MYILNRVIIMKKRIYITIIICLVFKFLWSNNDKQLKIIHVFVALCDNINQGIVPVPKSLGNGQNPFNNLYWGAAYGVKTFFCKKSKNWKFIRQYNNPKNNIIERIILKSTNSNTYLVADAYDGKKIKQTIKDFLCSLSGEYSDTVKLNNAVLKIGAKANMVAYIGHNGLMDFQINHNFKEIKSNKKDVIILACCSKSYFKNYIKRFGANPLVWSTGLMSPEAYTLKWAIDGWLKNESKEQIILRARKAYNHYQKCGMRGAARLLTSGF